MKTKLMHLDAMDFEKAARIFKKAGRKEAIESFELSYLTSLMLSICLRGLPLKPDEAELLDRAIGIVMVRSDGEATS